MAVEIKIIELVKFQLQLLEQAAPVCFQCWRIGKEDLGSSFKACYELGTVCLTDTRPACIASLEDVVQSIHAVF